MAEPKTRKTTQSPAAFLATVPDERLRKDCVALVRLMRKVTGAPPAMWGPSIVGFGSFALPSAGGTTHDWPVAAFAPRKPDLVVYLLPGFTESATLRKLGPHRAGKSCLYVRSLAEVDLGVLEQLIATSVAQARQASAAKAAKKKAAMRR